MLEKSTYSSGDFPRAMLRSLLQKVVRRGRPDLAEAVAIVLAKHGDSKWLNTRAGIIVFEECWTLSPLLNAQPSTIHTLKTVSRVQKNKNAAGLGSLGYAYSIGDQSAVSNSADSLAIRIVAAGIKRPDDFFKWAISKTSNSEQTSVIFAAEIFFRRATWAWDKAFTIAASYLACSPLPPTNQCNAPIIDDFPYWIAVDKHTPEGKIILKNVAHDLDLSPLKLSWISFYLESSVSNSITASPWWVTEKKWRLTQLGINEGEAEKIWKDASTLIKEKTRAHAINIENILSGNSKFEKNTNTLL